MRDGAESAGSRERGFVLVELMVSLAILSVGLLGFASVMTLQGGIAAGTSGGLAAVSRGYYVSAATMLAQERIEQVKSLRYALSPAVDEIADPVPAALPDEAFGTIAGFASFSRQLRVQNYPAVHMKTVTVTVSFNVARATGVTTEAVALSTVVAARP